jgi:hypothetical protein
VRARTPRSPGRPNGALPVHLLILILNQQQTLHREGRRYRGGARAGHVAQSGRERLVEQGLLLVARRRRETTGAKVGGSGGGGGGAAGAGSDAGVGVRGLECAITVIYQVVVLMFEEVVEDDDLGR